LDLQQCDQTARLYGACVCDVDEGFHPGSKKTEWKWFVKTSPRAALAAAKSSLTQEDKNALDTVWPTADSDVNKKRRNAVVDMFVKTLLWKPATASCTKRRIRAQDLADLRMRAIISATFDATFGPDDANNPARLWKYAPKPLPAMRIEEKPAVVIEYRDGLTARALQVDNARLLSSRLAAELIPMASINTCLDQIANVTIAHPCSVDDGTVGIEEADDKSRRGLIDAVKYTMEKDDFFTQNAKPLYCKTTKELGTKAVQDLENTVDLVASSYTYVTSLTSKDNGPKRRNSATAPDIADIGLLDAKKQKTERSNSQSGPNTQKRV
jgi:hypothetical protein